MKHHYVSLGSACDVAMMFDLMKIRSAAYPFDWLWNNDYGLKAVNALIAADFSQILDAGSYETSVHYRLGYPVVVYKQFPNIIHLHTNPMTSVKEHKVLARRINRFRKLIKSDDFLHFVYYKNYNEALLVDPSTSIGDTVETMVRDAQALLERLSKRRPGKPMSLLLILQSDIGDEQACRDMLEDTRTGDRRIQIGYTITRYDEDSRLFALWHRQWRSNLLRRSRMPLAMALGVGWRSVKASQRMPQRLLRVIERAGC